MILTWILVIALIVIVFWVFSTYNFFVGSKARSKVASLLPDIKLIMESNPEIKGSEVVVKLMDELRDTSDKIMYARRLVIDLTVDYNVKRVSVPSSFIATLFKFDELPGLITPQEGEHVEVKAEETKTPKISL